MNKKDKIIHARYGEGVVRAVSDDGSILTIKFKSQPHVQPFRANDPEISAAPVKKTKLQEKREKQYLWTDEETGEDHFVYKDFVRKFQKNIGIGAENRQLRRDLLLVMGEKEGDGRDIRGACHYLIHACGILVVSIRSGDGGYFVAKSIEERDKYAADQRKFADSMYRTAARVETIDIESSLRNFQEGQDERNEATPVREFEGVLCNEAQLQRV